MEIYHLLEYVRKYIGARMLSSTGVDIHGFHLFKRNKVLAHSQHILFAFLTGTVHRGITIVPERQCSCILNILLPI